VVRLTSTGDSAGLGLGLAVGREGETTKGSGNNGEEEVESGMMEAAGGGG
jgi:hypothetical protein